MCRHSHPKATNILLITSQTRASRSQASQHSNTSVLGAVLGLTSLELPLRPSYCFFDFGSSRLHGLPMRKWLWQSYVACRSSCYTFDYEHERDSVVYIHSMRDIILRRRQQLANAVCMEAFLRPTQEAPWGCPANPWNCPANPQCGPANPWGEPLGLSGEPLCGVVR